MPWETTPYRPPIQNPKGRVASSPNAPLARCCGSIAFCLTCFAACKAAESNFGLKPGFLDAKWGPRETVVVGILLLLSMLGGLFGFGVALQVSIRNRDLTRLANILWHFFANGQIVCFFVLALALGKQRRSLGSTESLHVFGTYAAASILAGLVLFLAGQFKENAPPRPLLWASIVVPPAIWASLRLDSWLRWQPREAILCGLALGLGNLFISARSIQRDYAQMKEENDWRDRA